MAEDTKADDPIAIVADKLPESRPAHQREAWGALILKALNEAGWRIVRTEDGPGVVRIVEEWRYG